MTTKTKTYSDPNQAPRARDGGPPDAWAWCMPLGVIPEFKRTHPKQAFGGQVIEAVPLYREGNGPCSECAGLRARSGQRLQVNRLLFRAAFERGQMLDTATDEVNRLRTELEAAQTAVALAALNVEQAEAERDEALAELKTCRANRNELAQSQRELSTTIGSLRAEVAKLREAVRGGK